MEEVHEQIKQRLKKLRDLRGSGIEPYGGPFEVTAYATDILRRFSEVKKEELEVEPVMTCIAGRSVAMRDFGKAIFVHIQRYLDLIVNPDVRKIFEKRSSIIKAIRGRLGMLLTNTQSIRDVILFPQLKPEK